MIPGGSCGAPEEGAAERRRAATGSKSIFMVTNVTTWISLTILIVVALEPVLYSRQMSACALKV